MQLLKQDSEAQKSLAVEVYRRFHSMKTYGKSPESLESITAIFLADLAEFPINKILAAIKTHSQRSQEFPTVSDIVGIIKRNGKPPLKESDIIAIRKKDAENRTRAEWDLLAEWDRQQNDAWDEPEKQPHLATENMALRQTIRGLREEVSHLDGLLKQQKVAQGVIPQEVPLREQIRRTAEAMKYAGSPQAHIDEFLASYQQHQAIPGEMQ